MTQMSQTAICNRHHSLERRLWRLLLLSLYRVAGNALVMAQELIAGRGASEGTYRKRPDQIVPPRPAGLPGSTRPSRSLPWVPIPTFPTFPTFSPYECYLTVLSDGIWPPKQCTGLKDIKKYIACKKYIIITPRVPGPSAVPTEVVPTRIKRVTRRARNGARN